MKLMKWAVILFFLVGCQQEVKPVRIESLILGMTHSQVEEILKSPITELFKDGKVTTYQYQNKSKQQAVLLYFKHERLSCFSYSSFDIAKDKTKAMPLERLEQYSKYTNKLDVVDDFGVGHEMMVCDDYSSELEYADEKTHIIFRFYANQLRSIDIEMQDQVTIESEIINQLKFLMPLESINIITKKEIQIFHYNFEINEKQSQMNLDNGLKILFSFNDKNQLIKFKVNIEEKNYLPKISNINLSQFNYQMNYQDVLALMKVEGNIVELNEEHNVYAWMDEKNEIIQVSLNNKTEQVAKVELLR